MQETTEGKHTKAYWKVQIYSIFHHLKKAMLPIFYLSAIMTTVNGFYMMNFYVKSLLLSALLILLIFTALFDFVKRGTHDVRMLLKDKKIYFMLATVASLFLLPSGKDPQTAYLFALFLSAGIVALTSLSNLILGELIAKHATTEIKYDQANERVLLQTTFDKEYETLLKVDSVTFNGEQIEQSTLECLPLKAKIVRNSLF